MLLKIHSRVKQLIIVLILILITKAQVLAQVQMCRKLNFKVVNRDNRVKVRILIEIKVNGILMIKMILEMDFCKIFKIKMIILNNFKEMINDLITDLNKINLIKENKDNLN